MGRGCRAAVLALALASRAWAEPETAEPFESRKVEQLWLDDVHAGRNRERIVDLYLRALNQYGEPAEQLKSSDLAVVDNGKRIDSGDVMLSSLGEAGLGLTCVVAIDVSRTMQGEPFAHVREAALQLLEHIESRDRVAVVTIADEVRVVAPFSASRGDLEGVLQGLGIAEQSLGTVLYDGIHESVELIRRTPDELRRRAFVILFSDGSDSSSQRTLEEVIQAARGDDLRPPILVFTIGYVRFGGGGLEILKRISEETGGHSFQPDATIHMSSLFGDIWRQMKRSYVARYAASMDGKPHTIQITSGELSDKRRASYPVIRPPLWPYLAVFGLAGLVGVVALLVVRGRSPGKLVFVGGVRAGERVGLHSRKTRIGALPDNEVVIPSETVSRYHAAIHRKGRELEIEDLNSSNGTFVNGTPVRTSRLRPGDKIRIADVDLVYER